MKITNGFWYISLDGGKTWTEYIKATGEDGKNGTDGVAADLLFADIFWTEDSVIFTLVSGDVITVPKYKAFALTIDSEDEITVSAGDVIEIGYEADGFAEDVEVTCMADGGLNAVIVKEDAVTGLVRVSVPSSFVEGKVSVIASDGEGHMAMKPVIFKVSEN